MASILVVDDESSMREMLEILLRKQGHEVHLAADAPAAVARAAQGDLDLVVSRPPARRAAPGWTCSRR